MAHREEGLEPIKDVRGRQPRQTQTCQGEVTAFYLWLNPLPHRHEALSSDLQHPYKRPDIYIHVYNPDTGSQRQVDP